MSVVANVAINVDSRNAVSNLRQVERQAQITQRAFDGLSSALASIGVGLALGKVIQDVKELDTNLRRLGTVGVDVAKINPALARLSDELGGVANKAELAAASYQAASAGFSDTAGNIQILNAATKAAVGGLADTSAVTEVLVKTLNAYGMSGREAFKVTDSISKAVELGNQEWSDYTSLLGRVASISALAGVSIDELNAFIASATKNGATAEVAFTGLGAVLNTLLQPTKESQEAAAALGIAWNYGGLQAKGFTGLMAELAKAMEKDKETTARLLGSQEAMRGAFAANAKGGADFRMVLEQLSGAAGKTDSDFNTMKGSLENTLKALDTSFKNLSEALGRAFGPTVVLVIQDITKGINGFADVMNAVPQPVLNATGQIIKMIVQAALLKKAIEGIIALRAGFAATMVAMGATTAATGTAATASASAFALYTRNTQAIAAAAASATPKLAALRGILGSIAAMSVITVAVNIIVNGLQETLAANAELAKLRGRRAAGGAAATFAGATKETVVGAQGQARKTQAAIKKERAGLTTPGARALQFLNVGGALSPFGVQTITGAGQRLQVLGGREREAQAILGLSVAGRPSASSFTGGAGGAPTGGGGGATGGKTAANEAKKLADELQRSFERGNDLFRQFSRQAALLGNITEEERKRLQIQYDFQDRAREIGELKNKEQKTNLTQLNDEIRRLQLLELQTDEIKKQLELFYERAGFSGQPKMLPSGAGAFRTDISLGSTDKATQKYEEMRAKLKELTNPVNAAATGAQAISGAFGSAFQSIITGAQSTQDALSEVFKNIGESFINMATEILAQMMMMYVFKQLLGLFGGGNTGPLFSGAGPVSGASVFGSGQAAFNPAAFGGLQLFADGGFVTGPTRAMVGEGGESEYIIPASKMRSAMSRYAAGARGSAVIPAGDDTSSGGGTATMAPAAIDVRYTVERINSVDYVTADQFRAGMAQAAQQGATQGEQRTLRRLQQSRATRSRLGMN